MNITQWRCVFDSNWVTISIISNHYSITNGAFCDDDDDDDDDDVVRRSSKHLFQCRRQIPWESKSRNKGLFSLGLSIERLKNLSRLDNQLTWLYLVLDETCAIENYWYEDILLATLKVLLNLNNFTGINVLTRKIELKLLLCVGIPSKCAALIYHCSVRVVAIVILRTLIMAR